MDEKEKHAKDFAKFIIDDGLRSESSLGNIGILNDDGEYGFSEVLEDPADGDSIAIEFVPVDELYSKFKK